MDIYCYILLLHLTEAIITKLNNQSIIIKHEHIYTFKLAVTFLSSETYLLMIGSVTS